MVTPIGEMEHVQILRPAEQVAVGEDSTAGDQ